MSKGVSVLFVCRNFHQMAGGVERMATLIMNDMAKRGFRIGLVTWDLQKSKSYFPIDSSIKWIKLNLGCPNKKANWMTRLKRQIKLRKTIKAFNPNVIIGFQVGAFVAARTSLFGLKIPIIAAERNSPDLFKFHIKGKMLQRYCNLILKTSTCITVQLESYIKKYPFYLRKKIITIPNPVQFNKNPKFPNEARIPPKRILNIGRLVSQKNQIFLINAFALIAHYNPDWVLTIVGNGEKLVEIKKLIKNLKLSHQVELVPATKNVDYWYCNSAIFAFPSLWEGFPNVLMEAFRQGLPAIGLKQTAGVNELLMHEVSGLLSANDLNSYALSMQRMIDDLEFRKISGRNAHRSTLSYQPEYIFDQWAKVFNMLANRT